MRLLVTSALLLLIGAGPVRADDEPAVTAVSKEAFTPAKDVARGKVKECCGLPVAGNEGYKLTFYWLALEADYANERYDTPIYTREGFLIGRFPSPFVWEMGMEGTGVTLDGRVLNYAGQCNYGMGTCFKQLDTKVHPLGTGVQGRPLEPLRSIAVDPKRIPIGAPVWIPELAGLELPDGTRHDGCLRADDQGGAIKAGRIDFFVENYALYKNLLNAMWWGDKVTPHVEEPRCEYLRLHLDREHQNELTDWIAIHQKQVFKKDRVSLAKMKRNRALAKAWIVRQSKPKPTAVASAKLPTRRGRNP